MTAETEGVGHSGTNRLGFGLVGHIVEVEAFVRSFVVDGRRQHIVFDSQSRSDTIPANIVLNDSSDVGHEAKIGRISNEAVFYLMSRGISEEEARSMIVSGFANPVSKELPLEYAVEMNNLIRLEMHGNT